MFRLVSQSIIGQGRVEGLRLRGSTIAGAMDAVLALLGMAAAVWFWVDSLRARELALLHCARLCREMDVQLLDHTVRVARLRLGRDRDGRVRLRRFYVCEFSINGADRWYGIAVLLGRHVEYVRMEHPDGPLVQGTIR
jgi:hypothetical protein